MGLGTEHDLAVPSGRIRFAVEAVHAAEADDRFEVDMSVFHYHTGTGRDRRCVACAGGLAALRRWNGMQPIYVDSGTDAATAMGVTYNELHRFEYSVDMARIGRISDTFSWMGMEESHGAPFNRVTRFYEHGRSSWAQQILTLADDLEEAGF